MAAKPPIAFQRGAERITLDEISKAAWVDIAVQLVSILHDADKAADLSEPQQLAGLLLAYASPVLQSRGDRNPLAIGKAEQAFDASGLFAELKQLRAIAETWDVPPYTGRPKPEKEN